MDQFGDDPRPILEVALEQATPNRISKAWVRHRIEEVIGQISTVLDDDQIEAKFALLFVSYPTSDCVVETEKEEELY